MPPYSLVNCIHDGENGIEPMLDVDIDRLGQQFLDVPF